MRAAIVPFITGIILLLINSCSTGNTHSGHVPPYNTFNKLKITNIQPDGWIREFLERQSMGLTGNIEVAGYPFNTCMWACEKIKGSTKAWWPYEQTAYYIDGVHRLGLLLDDPGLIQKARLQTQYVMNHINPETGRVSTQLQDRWWRWPYANFFRNYMTEFEESGDLTIVEALHRHYLTFTEDDFADDLELANVEQIAWLYGITGDKKLLDMAEKAYRLFNSNIEYRNRAGCDIQFSTDRIPDHHGVVYLELVKIPAILYSYTAKSEYLEDALNGIRKMEAHHMLVSGLPSTTEHFSGISELAGHETCNTAVFPYTYGIMLRATGNAELGDKIERAVFNAGLGSITKDFKTHQYFSAPNQVLATSTSNPFGHHPARMAFLPGHDVECCTGNVNRFMPYYVEQMWMKAGENGLVATLFGPSTLNATAGKKNTPVTITEETTYPFSGIIRFTIHPDEDVSFPFYIRIPKWSSKTEILLNGVTVEDEIQSGTFFNLERKYRDGDEVTLKLSFETITSTWPNKGVAVERGPLVFSLPVAASVNVLENYEKSTGEFPGYELRPDSDWNYALSLEDADIEVISHTVNGYPWDPGNTPVTLKVPARKLSNWKLEESYDDKWKMNVLRTPGFPGQILPGEVTEYIELVPYGSTLLRITVFPENNNIPTQK